MKGIQLISFISLLLPFVFVSCTTSGPGLFGKQSPHEQYGQKLTDAGLKETAMGLQWFSAAEQALANPVAITLPYREISFFGADKPRAVGLQFSGKRGEKLLFELKRNPAANLLFADLWALTSSAKPNFTRSIDTTQTRFELEIEDDNTRYILRLQPELLKSMDYELSISIAPSLAFPVAGGKGRIASIWGDARDAGARQHEGIDIFAPKRTPVVAAADGTVTRVNENNLGGRVVWLRTQGKAYSLYYAHLDEQLATDGQRVNKGDTIGLIGNTGNARTTPPHLHFGIYAMGGAVDPLPFVNPVVKKPDAVSTDLKLGETKLRLTKTTTLSSANFAATFAANTLVEPIAATTKSYRVALPNNTIAEVPKNAVQPATRALRQATVKNDTFLMESPIANAPRKMALPANTKVAVLGAFEQFYFVEYQNATGWISSSLVQ